jgi:hypothetical protein
MADGLGGVVLGGPKPGLLDEVLGGVASVAQAQDAGEPAGVPLDQGEEGGGVRFNPRVIGRSGRVR